MTRRGPLVLLFAVFGAALAAVLLSQVLRPSHGDLEVTSEPAGASVFLDQKFQGVTPRRLARVPRGTHQLRLALAGHHDVTRAIPIDKRRAAVHFNLRPIPPVGTLVVRSEPAGAHVWLDGERFLDTPARVESVSPGAHELKVERPGWLPHRETIQVSGDKEEVISVRLVSAKVPYYLDAIKVEPANPTNYVELGGLYIRAGEIDRAFDMLGKAVLAYGRRGRRWSRRWGKGFAEFLAATRAAEPDLRSGRWDALSRSLLEAAESKEAKSGMAGVVYQFFVEIGRWQEIVDLATSCLERAEPQSLYHVWRLHAAGKLGDWKQFDRDLDEILSPDGPKGYGAAFSLRPVLVDLGKWDKVVQLADFCIQRTPKDDPHRRGEGLLLWRLEALAKLKDWRHVSEAFDSLVEQGVVSRLQAPLCAEGPMFCAYQQTVLWMAARAKMKLGDTKTLEALLHQYEAEPEKHFWVSLIRGELWLRQPKGESPKPRLRVVPCGKAPEIDGRLQDEAWAKAPRASEFYDFNSTDRNKNRTTALALYDSQCLYLGVECVVPDDGRDAGAPLSDAAIEIFLDADRDYTTYKQFMLYSRGEPQEYACIKEPFCGAFHADPDWSPRYRSAVGSQRGTWCFELAIPYRILDTSAPKPGQAWSFNLVRSGTHEHPEPATFVPMYKSYHEPHRFALLVFR